MCSTVRRRKYRKPNWKYVELNERDIRLFKLILEQKFLRRREVIDYVFDGLKSYAEIRIRKLKNFEYIKAIQVLPGEPESYLLGKAGLRALKDRGACVGRLGFSIIAGRTFPEPQDQIEIACYEHDVKVTQVRLLFERMKLCKNWHSEKLLKMGTKGERKVPDGYFTKEGRGIAVELELHPKKAKGYRKIFDIYKDDSKTDYIFYVCGDISLKRRMMALVEKESLLTKEYCFILFKDLMEFGEEARIQIPLKGKFKLKAVLQHVR